MLETVLMVTDKFKTTSGIILKPKKKTSFYLIYPDLCLSSSIGREKKKVTKLDLILCDNLPAEDR